MIITEIVSVFFIEIGQVCMLSRTLILELGRGCLFSSITSEKQWLRSKKGKGFRMHAAHPPPLEFSRVIARKTNMNFDYGGG